MDGQIFFRDPKLCKNTILNSPRSVKLIKSSHYLFVTMMSSIFLCPVCMSSIQVTFVDRRWIRWSRNFRFKSLCWQSHKSCSPSIRIGWVKLQPLTAYLILRFMDLHRVVVRKPISNWPFSFKSLTKMVADPNKVLVAVNLSRVSYEEILTSVSSLKPSFSYSRKVR